jgi:hypothetical protein
MSDIPPEDKEVLLANFHELTSAPPRPALEGDEAEKTKCTCINMVIEGRCSYCLDREIVRLTRLAHHLSAQLEASKSHQKAQHETILGFNQTLKELSAQLVNQKAEAYKFAYEAYTEIKSLETQLAEARTLLARARPYVGMVSDFEGDDPIFEVMEDIDRALAADKDKT